MSQENIGLRHSKAVVCGKSVQHLWNISQCTQRHVQAARGVQSGLSRGLGRKALVLLCEKLHLDGKVRRFNDEKWQAV